MTDYGEKDDNPPNFKPLKATGRQTAVAIKESGTDKSMPTITAAGRGALAEQIMQIAFENGIKIREDADLAELLAKLELDSPIPTEALMAVAEILSYVYRANGQADPFSSLITDEEEQETQEDEIK